MADYTKGDTKEKVTKRNQKTRIAVVYASGEINNGGDGDDNTIGSE